jgi:non-ribosomal peptide synthase protein (TIGR01720 family)
MGQTGVKGSSVSQVLEDVGPTRGPNNIRSHLLEVNVGTVGGRLRADFYYSKNIHTRDTIKSFAVEYIKSLRGLIEHCSSPGAGGFTPSDFPKARMSQKDLDKLMNKIAKKNK